MKKLFLTFVALESILNLFNPWTLIANANQYYFDERAYNNDLKKVPSYCSYNTSNQIEYQVCVQQMFVYIENLKRNGAYHKPKRDYWDGGRDPVNDPHPCDNPLVDSSLC